jgi:hypothetical protein
LTRLLLLLLLQLPQLLTQLQPLQLLTLLLLLRALLRLPRRLLTLLRALLRPLLKLQPSNIDRLRPTDRKTGPWPVFLRMMVCDCQRQCVNRRPGESRDPY